MFLSNIKKANIFSFQLDGYFIQSEDMNFDDLKIVISPCTHTIQGISRVIMSPTELKMQPTIHLEPKSG
jgi:hypothetical protein